MHEFTDEMSETQKQIILKLDELNRLYHSKIESLNDFPRSDNTNYLVAKYTNIFNEKHAINYFTYGFSSYTDDHILKKIRLSRYPVFKRCDQSSLRAFINDYNNIITSQITSAVNHARETHEKLQTRKSAYYERLKADLRAGKRNQYYAEGDRLREFAYTKKFVCDAKSRWSYSEIAATAFKYEYVRLRMSVCEYDHEFLTQGECASHLALHEHFEMYERMFT